MKNLWNTNLTNVLAMILLICLTSAGTIDAGNNPNPPAKKTMKESLYAPFMFESEKNIVHYSEGHYEVKWNIETGWVHYNDAQFEGRWHIDEDKGMLFSDNEKVANENLVSQFGITVKDIWLQKVLPGMLLEQLNYMNVTWHEETDKKHFNISTAIVNDLNNDSIFYQFYLNKIDNTIEKIHRVGNLKNNHVEVIYDTASLGESQLNPIDNKNRLENCQHSILANRTASLDQ